MENKFKVVMKKDDEVLRDFISFTYRAQGQTGRYKMRVLSLGLAAIGYLAAKGGNTVAGMIIGAIGVIFLIASLFLPQIAVARLKKADIAYQNQTELSYAFTNSGIYVYQNGELDQNVGGYGHVSCLYEDEKNFYVGINNEDLYLLPRKNFVEGNFEEFIEFMQNKSGEKSEFLPRTIKNKWMVYKVKVKQSDEEYDAKAAERRREAKEKRENKKNNKK